jgi:hypothetical protein
VAVPAMPPDVRRGFAPPSHKEEIGLGPSYGLGLWAAGGNHLKFTFDKKRINPTVKRFVVFSHF